jgi:hypothetical protein
MQSLSLESIPDSLSIWLTAFFFHSRIGRERIKSKEMRALFEVGLSAALFALPPHSILAWWRPLTLVLRMWPRIFGRFAPSSLVHGGPLGDGCGKICEVTAAYILWIVLRGGTSELPVIIWSSQKGSMISSMHTWLLVGVFCVLTNGVLQFWSFYTCKRGDHKGVHDVIHLSIGRCLSWQEHGKLMLLAMLNATSEEFSSRGFWKAEFFRASSQSLWYANLGQAVTFGWWHYYGIPSGWTGVGLTFVYGGILGMLQDYCHGALFIPIAAHTVADYFIFAVIARQKIAKES